MKQAVSLRKRIYLEEDGEHKNLLKYGQRISRKRFLLADIPDYGIVVGGNTIWLSDGTVESTTRKAFGNSFSYIERHGKDVYRIILSDIKLVEGESHGKLL